MSVQEYDFRLFDAARAITGLRGAQVSARYVYMCMYAYVHVCMYVCVYISQGSGGKR